MIFPALSCCQNILIVQCSIRTSSGNLKPISNIFGLFTGSLEVLLIYRIALWEEIRKKKKCQFPFWCVNSKWCLSTLQVMPCNFVEAWWKCPVKLQPWVMKQVSCSLFFLRILLNSGESSCLLWSSCCFFFFFSSNVDYSHPQYIFSSLFFSLIEDFNKVDHRYLLGS